MRIRLILLCLLLAWTLPLTAAATELDLSAPEPTATPRPAPALSGAPLLDAPPMTLNCAAALLLEPQSGQILFELNADAPRAVASVTKLMTILLSLEAVDDGRISLTDRVTISAEAAGMGGSQVLLDVGESQTVAVLLKSAVVGSANDAAVALAEALYGSEQLCAARMNARAGQLGMEHTHYVNCTGLPAEGQRTTARDVARLSAAVFSHENYYDFSKIWLDEVDHGDGRVTQLTNTNKLIRLYDGCDGGKTGSTDEALYCIAATARRGDMRLIAVVQGAPSGSERFDLAAKMFDYGFANYRLYPVAQRGTKIKGTLPVEGGRPDGVSLILDGDLTLLVTKGSEQDVSLVPELPERVEAPVEVGDLIGYVRVEQGGRTLAKLPVVAASASEIKGFDGNLKKLLRHWVLT